MATIALEGIKFHAYHGVYEAESVLGTDYLIDVVVHTDIGKAAQDDDITKTINYETIYQICDQEMHTPRKLIETVVQSIIMQMKHQFSTMQAIKVRVSKLNPPLGGNVRASWVEEEEEYGTSCPRCNKGFLCYGDDTCWCNQVNIHPATKETVQRQFKKCLCPKCMEFFAG